MFSSISTGILVRNPPSVLFQVNAARYGGHFLRETADAEEEARSFAPGYGADDGTLAGALWSKAEALSGQPFDPAPMLT